MKIRQLVAILKKKDQEKEVEFIVVGTDDALITMLVSGKAADMVKMLKHFPGVRE